MLSLKLYKYFLKKIKLKNSTLTKTSHQMYVIKSGSVVILRLKKNFGINHAKIQRLRNIIRRHKWVIGRAKGD